MAEGVPEKSRGLKFAEQQLLRHGWEHGKGLGRAENGISEPVKVKVKSNKGGVGHTEGEQFTFQWWDHVFNKASSSLEVETDPNGIKLKKTAVEDDDDNAVSNKKPRKASLAKAKLYGCFVKSATLLSGEEQPEPKASDSDDDSSSSEDDDQRLDLSSTTRLSDAQLIKACGGRTAHKGARHGLTMSAKLARLEQQEAEFMAKYGKKSQSGSSQTLPTKEVETQQRKEEEEEVEAGRGEGDEKKRKTKLKRNESPSIESEALPPGTEDEKKKKKKKKQPQVEAAEEKEEIRDVSVKQKKKQKKDKIIIDEEVPLKKKKKKKIKD
ncbi:G patch domain-containing protein 4 [Gouania willdenowi]|uniref:G patch domain-containing protein 4 n=1 Tax=Gouania willdenowi TaxID=441366 RepID=UPI0010569157|nr:G patch domain-containing protein 4-like [Gouania willdenowi]